MNTKQISQKVEAVLHRRPQGVSPTDAFFARHLVAVDTGVDRERALLMVLRGLALYADRVRVEEDRVVTDDCHLGDHYIDALRFVRAALTHERGRLDGSTVDRAIMAIAEELGIPADL